MTECRCAACSTKPLRTHGEAFRLETEVRYVASLPSIEDRRRYLNGVVERRGRAARDDIVDALIAMKQARAA